MASAPVDPHEAHAAAVSDAKRLMRLARTGALATLEAEGRRASHHAHRRRQRFRRRAAVPHVDAVAPYKEPRPRPARLAPVDRRP